MSEYPCKGQHLRPSNTLLHSNNQFSSIFQRLPITHHAFLSRLFHCSYCAMDHETQANPLGGPRRLLPRYSRTRTPEKPRCVDQTNMACPSPPPHLARRIHRQIRPSPALLGGERVPN